MEGVQTCCTSLSGSAQEEKKTKKKLYPLSVERWGRELQLPAGTKKRKGKNEPDLIPHMCFIKMKVNSIKIWIWSRRGKTLNVIRGLIFNSNEKDQQLLLR